MGNTKLNMGGDLAQKVDETISLHHYVSWTLENQQHQIQQDAARQNDAANFEQQADKDFAERGVNHHQFLCFFSWTTTNRDAEFKKDYAQVLMAKAKARLAEAEAKGENIAQRKSSMEGEIAKGKADLANNDQQIQKIQDDLAVAQTLVDEDDKRVLNEQRQFPGKTAMEIESLSKAIRALAGPTVEKAADAAGFKTQILTKLGEKISQLQSMVDFWNWQYPQEDLQSSWRTKTMLGLQLLGGVLTTEHLDGSLEEFKQDQADVKDFIKWVKDVDLSDEL